VIFASFSLNVLFDFVRETNQFVVDSCRGEANSEKYWRFGEVQRRGIL